MDNDFNDMDFEEGFEYGDCDSDYSEEYTNDDYSDNIDDENHYHEKQEHESENYISPEEASILGYGFGYEEALLEKKRRMQLWEDEQEQRKRDDNI